MFNISSYLDKFKNLGLKDLLLKEKIALKLKELIGVTVETREIVIKNGIITIKLDSSAKSELFIKKKRILDAINEGERIQFKDIR